MLLGGAFYEKARFLFVTKKFFSCFPPLGKNGVVKKYKKWFYFNGKKICYTNLCKIAAYQKPH